MSEERLRDLLERAVPEAPEIRADDVPVRAAAVRRRRVVAGGAALAVATAAVVGGIALRSAGDDEADVADDVPTTPTSGTAPYDVPVCPARLPEIADAHRVVPDLTDVVAVRLCPDLHPLGPPGGPVSSDDRARLADLDALVDVPAFADALAVLAAVPELDPNRCAAIDFVDDRGSLMFVRADGTNELVITSYCSAVTSDQGDIDGGDLQGVFLDALDRQRDELDYARPFNGRLTCDTRSFGTPARPGRERLVAAIACDPADELVGVLDGDQLAALQAAWDDPQAVGEDAAPEAEDDCRDLDDAPAYVKAVTDRSDVVSMFRSPCGYLVWDSWRPGDSAAIPTTLEELGLR